MLLHLSPQAELQSHLCDWCCLWTTFFPTSCLAFPRLVMPPAQRIWIAGAPSRWCDRVSLSSPSTIHITASLKSEHKSVVFAAEIKQTLCSMLSFMIKSFSNTGFLGCHYNKKKSNFSKRGAERQNPVMLSLILVFTQKHLNVMAPS